MYILKISHNSFWFHKIYQSYTKIMTTWETDYGLTKIFKIVDVNGNVYTWKTSGGISDDAKEIVGTVKSHNEYRGIKQTELTRVRTKA